MWTKLRTMFKHRYVEPNFKGFMADSAQANWNVVTIVYNSSDATSKYRISNPIFW
jgi:hypothetical protein